ncbi:MAG: hypothetical protein LDL25_06710 [Hyphomicrobiales bacterium]|uniref:hypothetical protein n=1 Tax=Rhabdaerophilum calidifontis TaxID=2604328 RepID=UPI00123A4EF2|nr:hypothetical protein [Rhabdaerophilum calidifontis]MCA1952545.1 hypothetical protein [Hyphomicrobiales bacterium]MCA1999464.1 hypothetical protein [Hyphomicrobiales bacterium]
MHSEAAAPRPVGLFYHLPLIGPMLRDAVFGYPDAKYYFLANVVIVFGWAGYLYGYAFFITVAKIAAVLVMSSIILLTSTDLWENRGRRRARNRTDRRPDTE